MSSTRNKPALHSVVDLGLRDIGVRNDPRRLAAQLGGISIRLFGLAIVSVFAMGVIVREAAVGAWIVVPVALAWMAVLPWLILRTAKRSPVMVVKVSAEGTNQAIWLLHVPFVLLALCALLTWDLRLVPVLLLAMIMAALVSRGRGRLPDVLRELRPLLAAVESVLGDGVGMARGARSWRDGFRLVVATDRRLLVTTSTRSTGSFVVLDAPYGRLTGFGVEWRYRGRTGALTLRVGGLEGAASETHVITSIAPANLVSIARALQSNGVPADDPEAVAEAERAWEEALQRGSAGSDEPRKRLLDRAAMGTPGFDRGLWVLLALSVVAFYLNPFGVGLGVSRDAVPLFLIVPALCVVCGYVSGTKWSLAYLVPFNLLVSPAFFVADASVVITVLVWLSVLAGVGLWAGWTLRERAARATAGAGEAASAELPPARGSLRYALGGLGLIQITGALLGVMVALLVVASAAGFELATLRLAVDELTLKQVPVDGRSNLIGNAASLTYTPGPDMHEFITDQHFDRGPNDGARWELRSSWTKGYNVVSLASYVKEPRLDDAAAVADFVARKDREHDRLAGFHVTHTERVVDGRKGYVWNDRSRNGYWYYAAWFPQPVHSVRIECIAKRQAVRFKRLCAEAVGSLKFH